VKQPELSLSFERGDILFDGIDWVIVESTNYETQEVLVNTLYSVYYVPLHTALRWYATRNGECVRNPWSKPHGHC
jgi:hypothetical protein